MVGKAKMARRAAKAGDVKRPDESEPQEEFPSLMMVFMVATTQQQQQRQESCSKTDDLQFSRTVGQKIVL